VNASRAPKARPGDSPGARPPRSGNAALGLKGPSKTQDGRRVGAAAVAGLRRSFGEWRCGGWFGISRRRESESTDAGARGLFPAMASFPRPSCGSAIRGSPGVALVSLASPRAISRRTFGALEPTVLRHLGLGNEPDVPRRLGLGNEPVMPGHLMWVTSWSWRVIWCG